jgi:hypothetical protein
VSTDTSQYIHIIGGEWVVKRRRMKGLEESGGHDRQDSMLLNGAKRVTPGASRSRVERLIGALLPLCCRWQGHPYPVRCQRDKRRAGVT